MLNGGVRYCWGLSVRFTEVSRRDAAEAGIIGRGAESIYNGFLRGTTLLGNAHKGQTVDTDGRTLQGYNNGCTRQKGPHLPVVKALPRLAHGPGCLIA
jgi:hypothetical protein